MKKWTVILSSIIILILLIADFIYLKEIDLKNNEPNLDMGEKEEGTETIEKEEIRLSADETIDYALANNQVHITFNKGKEWIEVPIKQHPILNEQSSMNDELAEGSYLLTKKRIAFLSSVETANPVGQLYVNYSFDSGITWHESLVDEMYLGNRFWRVDFIDDQFGYIIATGEKVVTQEVIYIYLTKDGGQSWQPASQEQIVTRLIADGGFIDNSTGFLSVSGINPTAPEVLVTYDSGKTWKQSVIDVPEQYQEIFVSAEMPYIEENRLAVLINQGPNGDYKGAKVKGKFISTDKGATWRFSTEVEANAD